MVDTTETLRHCWWSWRSGWISITILTTILDSNHHREEEIIVDNSLVAILNDKEDGQQLYEMNVHAPGNNIDHISKWAGAFANPNVLDHSKRFTMKTDKECNHDENPPQSSIITVQIMTSGDPLSQQWNILSILTAR